MLAFYLALLDNPDDEAAFEAFYVNNVTMLTKTAKRILFERKLPADLYQDVLQMAWEEIAKRFTYISSFPSHEVAPYIVTIVKNKCNDLYRKENRYIVTTLDEITDASVDVEDVIAGNEGYEWLVEMIANTSSTYRETLERKMVFEQANREIARALGISEALVAKRVQRGREMLIAQLEKEGIA